MQQLNACAALPLELVTPAGSQLAVSIESLLAARHTSCVDLGGRMSDAAAMLPTWRRLWRSFPTYVDIRDRLICQRDTGARPFHPSSGLASDLVQHLVEAELLKRCGAGFKVASPLATRRLTGGWLEEFGAVIAADAGCQEVRFGQRVTWTSRYTRDSYENEIDVLARYGDCLLFISCKALSPRATAVSGGPHRLFDAMKEVAYWREHFGAGRGKAMLLTTADFIDETRRTYWNSSLVERADVLGVTLVSADISSYDDLVTACRQAIT